MNRENVKKAIAIMERAKLHEANFNICVWQDRRGGCGTSSAEEELHVCGFTACFGGWVAISPEFQKDGGDVMRGGCPRIMGEMGEEAIAYWLDVRTELGGALCWVGRYRTYKGKQFYPTDNSDDITPQMVIDKLKELLDE